MRLTALIALLCCALAAPASAREATEDGLVPPAPPAAVFPVAGEVHFGQFAASFGGGRGHQGQDVFAACGTPVLAARDGVVADNRSEGAGGHYLVVESRGGRAEVYMHLRRPSPLTVGERVVAGQRIGAVGDSGVATDCHLHFESWTAPGWYQGRAVDPLPFLRGLR